MGGGQGCKARAIASEGQFSIGTPPPRPKKGALGRDSLIEGGFIVEFRGPDS